MRNLVTMHGVNKAKKVSEGKSSRRTDNNIGGIRNGRYFIITSIVFSRSHLQTILTHLNQSHIVISQLFEINSTNIFPFITRFPDCPFTLTAYEKCTSLI